jgi:peptidoglycan hydrolase-like protein with peptidoglycan-binding domain
MKRFLAIAVVLALGITVFGCGKKQEAAQEPMTMEALNTINAPAPTAPAAALPAAPAQATTQVELAPMPSIPLKPSAMDIQSALKNAGFYSGNIDGKIGPMTTKAIEAFQKENGLTVDGKVGPKTWAALGKYLVAQAAAAVKQ